MQIQQTYDEKLFSLIHNALVRLSVAEGIFKTLTAFNDWAHEGDEERAKAFANQNYDCIFDYYEEYEDTIIELERQ